MDRADAPTEPLTEIFRAYAPRVMAYALRRTDREDARDVVAETFLVAWRRLDSAPADPLPWLFAIAHRVLQNQTRGERRTRALVQRLGTTLPAVTTDPEPPDDEVTAALKRLSPADQEVLTLTFWDDLDRKQCAAALGCSTANVRLRLHRALRRIRRQLESDRAAGSNRVTPRLGQEKP